ncbi:MAG: nucleotide-binding universal stress UspA family protein [Marinoscillum sp.]|jgi:nucleotide-binding universal stress UspA family protein
MNAFRKLLIPTDFSMAAWNAVQQGLKMIEPDGVLTLLHVFPSRAKFSTEDAQGEDPDESLKDVLKTQLDEFCSSLRRHRDFEVISVILHGDVDEEIVSFIQKNEFDAVIMGINSNGLDNEPGSHIKDILAKANLPVMVVPNQLEKIYT